MIAVVVALSEEVGDFLKDGGFKQAAASGSVHFYESVRFPHVAVAEGGPGSFRAQTATRAAVERYHPGLIVSAGLSGGTNANLRPGDLVIGDTVWRLQGSQSGWTQDKAECRRVLDDLRRRRLEETFKTSNSPIRFGGVATVEGLVTAPSRKAWLGEVLSASVVDMETFWVLDTADKHGAQSIALRSVLDPLEQVLPPFVTQATEDAAQRSWWRAALYALRRPADVPSLISLSSQYKSAKRSLSSMLQTLAVAGADTSLLMTKAG